MVVIKMKSGRGRGFNQTGWNLSGFSCAFSFYLTQALDNELLKESFLLKYLSLLLLREDKVPILELSSTRKLRKAAPLTFSNMKRRKKM